jgi:Protein of unknown function (DUF2815)
MKIKIQQARLAFPVLFNPEQFQGEGEAAYSCSLLIGPKPDLEVLVGVPRDGGGLSYTKKMKLTDAIEQVGREKWKDKWPTVKKNAESKDLNCLHDGDMKADYAGFAGQWYVSCRSSEAARPKVVDSNGSPLTQRDGRIYAGCYVVGLIELWAQDNAFGKRVNAQIRGVQFLRDGDAFSGAAPASDDEFDDVSEGADADDIG